MYSNVTTSTRINILQCTYVHLRLFYLRVILQGFVDPIMQQKAQKFRQDYIGPLAIDTKLDDTHYLLKDVTGRTLPGD